MGFRGMTPLSLLADLRLPLALRLCGHPIFGQLQAVKDGFGSALVLVFMIGFFWGIIKIWGGANAISKGDSEGKADTIAKLRTYGFHWTASRACWQRLRNDSARYAATQITGVRWPDVAPVASVEPSIATVNTVASGTGVRSGFAA